MDEHFKNWKEENKEFCKTANEYEVQLLYITENIINGMNRFKELQLIKDKAYLGMKINKIIILLACIRSIVNSLKYENSS